MQTLSYDVNPAQARRCKEEYMILKTSMAAAAAPAERGSGRVRDVAVPLALHHKLLCTVVKHAHQLRILNRQGRYADVQLSSGSSVRYIASSATSTLARPVLFYAVCANTLALLAPTTLASGELSVSVKEATLLPPTPTAAPPAVSHSRNSASDATVHDGHALVAAVAGEAERVYVLGRQHVYEVNEATATLLSSFALSPRTVVHPGCFDYHAREQLLLVPAKTTCLDVVCTRTRASVLAGLWEPHGELPPTFARFMQSREHGAHDAVGELRLLTAARGNTELRYWTYNTTTRRFMLRQEVLVTVPRNNNNNNNNDDDNNNGDNSKSRDGDTTEGRGADGGAIHATTPTTTCMNADSDREGGEADYTMCVTPGDEYVVLCSRHDRHILVVKNSRTQLHAEHVTMWHTAAPSLACAAYVGKFADSLLSQSALLELCVVLCTANGVVKCILGSDRQLARVTYGGDAVAASTTDSVAAWFDDAVTPLPPPASSQPTTSTITTTTTTTPAAAAAAHTPATLVLQQHQQQQALQAQLLPQPRMHTNAGSTAMPVMTSTSSNSSSSSSSRATVALACGDGGAGVGGVAMPRTVIGASAHTAAALLLPVPPPPPTITTTAATTPTPSVAPLTAVSSSVRGDSKSTHAISEASAAGLLRQQSHKFCEQVRLLDADLARLQKMASNTMCMLQTSTLRDQARASGQEFARRNKLRLPLLDATGRTPSTSDAAATAAAAAATKSQLAETATTATATTATGIMSDSQRKLILAISSVMKEVEGSTANAAAAALKTLLQRQLKQSVERATREAEMLDVPGNALGNIATTDAAAQFRRALSEATSQVLKATRERHDSLQSMLELAEKETSVLLAQVQDTRDRLNAAVQETRAEVGLATATLAQLQCTRTSEPVDPDVLIARAVALAERDDWVGAFTIALEASDVTVLLGFLESRVCQDKHAIAKSPSTITLPLFLSLCLQLTFEMDAHMAALPLRVQLLHDLYLEWDDILKDMKALSSKSDAHSMSFDTVKRELANVAVALANVDIQQLDRRTRSKFRLVTKLIDALTQPA